MNHLITVWEANDDRGQSFEQAIAVSGGHMSLIMGPEVDLE